MFRQLILKEYHLQRSTLMFVLGLVLLWALMLLLTPLSATKLGPCSVGQLLNLLQTGIIGLCMLGLIPLMLGAGMVTEERKHDVWNWQLSLPASRWRQWTAKIGFGAVVTLALTFIVLPIMDAILVHLCPEPQQIVPPLSELLGWNNGYFFLPLLLLATGAYASSLFHDPTKALLCGGILFGCTIACTWITDPNGIMLYCWNRPQSSLLFQPGLLPYVMTPWYSPLLVLSLVVIVAALTYCNFRFETPRWHRLFLHTILLVALTSAITHVTLREELYPQQIRIGNGVEGKKGFESVLSTNPFPLSKKIAVTIVSWIAPASIKNPEKSWRGRMALALFQYLNINAPPLANTQIENLSRTPGNNRLRATLSMKVNKPSDTTTVLWSQVVEIDLDKHQLKSFDPELHGLTYALEIKRNTPSAHPSQNTLPGNVPLPAATDFPSGMVLDGIHIPDSWGRWPIHPKLGLWGLLQGEKDSPEKSFLVKKNANGDWSTVDSAILETSLSGRYSVSADGKWFMRTCRYYTSDSLTDTSVTVFATDHSTSWTISNPQSKLPMRQFLSWGYGSEEDFQRINHRGVYSFLPVSPSGRFLAFQRVQETTVASSGKLREFRDIIDGPELIESYLLDLQTGKEITLRQQKTSLSESRQKMLKKLMQTKAWEAWMQADKDTEGKCAREVRKTEEYESLLCTLGIGAFMPVWAPDQDRLALWNEEDRTKIYLFDVSADAVVDGPRVIDLGENSHLDDMGFWDSKTLLTLDGSRSSLSKIDIEKAAQR